MNAATLPDLRAMWERPMEKANNVTQAKLLLQCVHIGLDDDTSSAHSDDERRARLRHRWTWALRQPKNKRNAFGAAVIAAAAIEVLFDWEEIELVVQQAVYGFGELNCHLVRAVFELGVQHAAPTSRQDWFVMAWNVLHKAKNTWIHKDSDMAMADDDTEDHVPGSAMPRQRQVLHDSMVGLIHAVMVRVAPLTMEDEYISPDDLQVCDVYHASARACLVRLLVSMLTAQTNVPIPERPEHVALVALTQLMSSSLDDGAVWPAPQVVALQRVLYTTMRAVSMHTNPWDTSQSGGAWLKLNELRRAIEVMMGLLNNKELYDRFEEHRRLEAEQLVARSARLGIVAAAMQFVAASEADTEQYEQSADSDDARGGTVALDAPRPQEDTAFWDRSDSVDIVCARAANPKLAESKQLHIVMLALGLDTTVWHGAHADDVLEQHVFQPDDAPEHRACVLRAIRTVTRKFEQHPMSNEATLRNFADRCVRIIMQLLLEDDNAYAVFYYAALNIVTKGGVTLACDACDSDDQAIDVQSILGPFACMMNHQNTIGVANNRDQEQMCAHMQQALGAVGRMDGTAHNVVVNLGFGETHLSARRHHELLHKGNTRVITCEFNTWVMGLGDNPRAMQIMRASVLLHGLHLLPFNIETMRMPYGDVLNGCTLGITSWYANSHVDYTQVLSGSEALASVFCLCYNQDITGMKPCCESRETWPRVVTSNTEALNKIDRSLARKRVQGGDGAGAEAVATNEPAPKRRRRAKPKHAVRLGL